MGTCLSHVAGLFRCECIVPWKFDEAPGRPGKSQKEGQEDQGTLKALGGVHPSPFTPPWSSCLSFWLFPGLPGAPSNYLYNWPVRSQESRSPGVQFYRGCSGDSFLEKWECRVSFGGWHLRLTCPPRIVRTTFLRPFARLSKAL